MDEHDDTTATFPECLEAARLRGASIVARPTRELVCLEVGMDGWAPLFRSLVRSPIRRNPQLLAVYVNCLLEASWSERDVEWESPYGLVKVHLLPGQCVFGDRRWSADLGIPHATLSRCVTRLERVSKVRREVRRGYSVISVPELQAYYAKGLAPETSDETPLRRGRDELETSLRPREEVKKGTREEVENKIKPPSSPRPKTGASDGRPEPPGFAEFWAAYPRRVGKGEARKVWTRLKVNGRLPVILDAIERQKKSDQWTRDNGQYIPHPATWLRQERWEDAVETSTSDDWDELEYV